MRRFKGRSANACHYCRTQKVKCSGERPCTRCQTSDRDCIFPSKDRLVTVPETYVRTLQNELNRIRQSSLAERDTPIRRSAERQRPHDANPERLIENSTTEYFVSKLKGACSVIEPAQSREHASPETAASISRSGPSHNHHRQHTISNYTYVPLDYETSNAKVAVKLPPYSYALYLLNQFETFIGSNYHWYHRQNFHDKMETTYNSPHKQSVDKAWLCCFSVVLALGESYTCRVAPSFIIDETAASNSNTQISQDAGQAVAPPGIELFKQGLLLLKPSYEEPTIEQIEALNLIAFYSYSLNRRRTAYAYAGMALRLAKIMGLPTTPDPRDIEPVELEHRKRVWWTTICMDLMTCTELSIEPTDGFDDDRIGFPDNSSLSSMEAREAFSDPQYLTAQVELHRIKYRIIERISELRSGDADETHRLLAPCLEALRYWRLEFHASLEYAEDGGFAEITLARPEMRTIASILMRYNQCYILLLRPLLLKQLSSLVKEQAPLGNNSSDLVSLNAECLRAARDNSLIQIALHKCHKIAKFGFWESLHIFSSLTIQIISNFIIEKSPASFPSTEAKSSYQAVRDLLGEMAQVGNLASRDHELMIRDIEGLFATGPLGSIGPTTDDIGDLAAWGDLLDFGNTGFDAAIFDAFPSSLENF